MKVVILAVLFVILAQLVGTQIGRANELAAQAYPTDVKSVLGALPFQHYNLMAQCSRLAYLAGYEKLSADHLAVAKVAKPKSVPDSDIAYRSGYVDGRMSNEYAWQRGRFSIKQIARSTYKHDCPGLV